MREILTQFLKENFQFISDDIQIDADTNLLQIGMDSLEMVEVVNFIETTFNIKIPDADINPKTFSSVRSIENLINKYRECNEKCDAA